MLSKRNVEDAQEIKQLQQSEQQLKRTCNELLVKCNETTEELDKVKMSEIKLSTKIDALSERIINQLTLENDDKMVKYYTGLPSFSVLKAVFDFVKKGLPENQFLGCSHFDQFLLTVVKLRLNIGDQDLAYRFGINQFTVSRCVARWLDILYTKLSPLIYWPDREQLLKTMPTCFRCHFRKCAIIIDCFEVFIERPTSLKPRAQTWSNYKKHNTYKFLIGITPQGSIAFISSGWRGRVSDVHLTENCGLLSKLLPGDVILADCGFTIEQSAGMYCAEVKIPPFTKGKKQLSKLEVDSARQLAQVRIHVERLIGVLRQKYSILQSMLPIKMIKSDGEDKSSVDKIVIVCSALCNCCESVVPF